VAVSGLNALMGLPIKNYDAAEASYGNSIGLVVFATRDADNLQKPTGILNRLTVTARISGMRF
jgi:hypothetical protein